MSLSLLPTRDLTPEERAAYNAEPRPGVWAGEGGADLRALTQDETDTLVRYEVYQRTEPDDRFEVRRIVGPPANPDGYWELKLDHRFACRQRGGIDSDPFVRLLAYRTWGDRDRQWFELRGVRNGELVAELRVPMGSNAVPLVALTWAGDMVLGRALHDAWPGEVVEVERSTEFVPQRRRVGDRLRQRDTEPDRER
jgi:hypothetical protein